LNGVLSSVLVLATASAFTGVLQGVKCIADATPTMDTNRIPPTTAAVVSALVDRIFEPPCR
jgi:hypothetical protein